MIRDKSKELYEKAVKLIPGGVNSPVRAFGSVGMEYPIFMKSGKGSKITDADGNSYIDYVMSWGALIFGHCYEPSVNAAIEAAKLGSTFGFATEKEIELAELISGRYKNMEMVRLTSSGTEAVMTAVRLARAYTGRSKIVKFNGCYHGHSDSVLNGGGSGLLTHNIMDANGITKEVVDNTIVLEYNDTTGVREYFNSHGKEIAAVIVEPVAANMGVVLPANGFLEMLREVTIESGAILIFDEVITGCRVAGGGAGELFGIGADLMTIGKIVGGGYPLAAVGGKKEIMKNLAPQGAVYHAGTLSGNPVAVAAGIEVMKRIADDKTIYKELKEKREYLQNKIVEAGKKTGADIHCEGVGSLMTLYFGIDRAENLNDVSKCDREKYGKFFRAMADRGVILPPSQFEAWFISTAHSYEDLDKTAECVEQSFEEIK